MRLRRPPLARAVAAAEQVLALRRIFSPEAIDLDAIAHDHRITLRRQPIGNAEGRLVRSGRFGVITIDEQAYWSEKWRFVLAHELGHFLLHEYLAKLACFPKRGATSEEKSRSFLDEQAASDFGVELLVPAGMMRLFLETAYRTATPMQRALAVSARFGVSPPTSALRMLDFTEEPCAVAYSEGGVVVWCTATRAFGVNVPKGARVPEGTVATRRTVHAGAWGRAKVGIEEVVEESVKLEPFDAVVTMLWHRAAEARVEGGRADRSPQRDQSPPSSSSTA